MHDLARTSISFFFLFPNSAKQDIRPDLAAHRGQNKPIFSPAGLPRTWEVGLSWVWLVVVYLTGLLWFGLFFDWGREFPLFHDWANVNVPRLTFLRSAVQTGQFPLHISDAGAMHGGTVRYLTIPDTITSPQILLLARFSPLRFNLINVAILYSIGFAGLVALRSRLRLSLFTFSVVALLYNFNGNLLAHFSAGHLTWAGYFLFSWFILLILRLKDGERTWRWTFYTACLLFAVWLQGSFHQVLWLLLFLGLCAFFIRGAFWFVLRALLVALLVCAFRLLPPLLLLGVYTTHFNNGYIGLESVFTSLIAPGFQTEIVPVPYGFHSAGGWEFSAYIGLASAAALLWFGVARGLVSASSPFRPLALPLAGMFLLSFNDFFAWLRLLPVPLIQGERVVTRVLSLPLAFLILIAAERFQRWWEEQDARGPTSRLPVGALFFLAIALSETWLAIRTWRIANIRQFFPIENFYAYQWFVANDYSDTVYLWLVFAGLAITLASLTVTSWLAFSRRGKRLAKRTAS